MDTDEFARKQQQRIIAHWQATRGKPAQPSPSTDVDDLELLQREAAARAAEMWDPEEANEFRGGMQRITYPLIDAIEAAADDFAQRRVTPYWQGTYHEYLQTPHWHETRERALQRAGYHCQRCSQTTSLQVHHLDYRHLGAGRERDLMVLCHECHLFVHAEDSDAEAD